MLVFTQYNSAQDNGDLYRMGDSPRLLPSTSASSMCNRIISQCIPSTSFSSSTSVLDLNPLASSLLAGYQHQILAQQQQQQQHQQQAGYSTRVFPAHPHPTHESLLKMHNTPVIVEPEADIDVVGLTDPIEDDEKSDSIDLDGMLMDEKNIDKNVTIQQTTVLPSMPVSPHRPTVIVGKANTTIRRSVSSASSIEPDVHEHFRRSLSGKWPKRGKTEEEKGRASPFRRHTSFNSHSPVQVINSKNIDIEDHFRRALGMEEFEAWKKKRDQTDS